MRSFNPIRLLSSRSSYSEKLPDHGGPNGAAAFNGQRGRWAFASGTTQRLRAGKVSLRMATAAIAFFVLVIYLFSMLFSSSNDNLIPEDETSAEVHANTRYWEVFPRLNGYYNGVKTLVKWQDWIPDELQRDYWGYMNDESRRSGNSSLEDGSSARLAALPLQPKIFNPYPPYNSSEWLEEHYPVHQCFIDERETQPAPNMFVFPGVPQNMVMPFFGSHDELGLTNGICFERFGRLGPYGYGYNAQEGGLGLGLRSEQEGAETIWQTQKKVDYRQVDWGLAQERCFEKNKQRFYTPAERQSSLKKRSDPSSGAARGSGGKKKLPRTAYVLRTYTGFEYTAHEIITLRAMINELSLKSGGEYDVHLLLHVKDDTIPIWTSKEVYQKVIEENIPPEFWGITTLWSVQQMRLYYPGPFGEPPANIAGQEIHGVYRSAHFALQWFAQEHQEYEYIWNWEMDIRYSGHYYEFHNSVIEWAKQQPRRGLWERNEKFWIPAYHGDWQNFTRFVDKETLDMGGLPVWGPVSFPNSGMLESPPENSPPRSYFDDDFEWGVGEDADIITFNPIFDPGKTNWVFRKDISGYDLNLPIPPRRCAIITVARLSRRLLDMMHEETYIGKHSAFPEMWPPTVALHHGFKAVYIPHPVFFDRKWPLDYMDQVFNYPENKINSPFGWGEHNWLGSSFYYNSGFSGALWRRWLGERENDEGGASAEIEGSGRMCLPSTLHHPIKNENMPES
ncbi:MAG: hypothetical protein Q9162_004921 [Coniocarpon cinnabarinum]